jgi:hypothetical protein
MGVLVPGRCCHRPDGEELVTDDVEILLPGFYLQSTLSVLSSLPEILAQPVRENLNKRVMQFPAWSSGIVVYSIIVISLLSLVILSHCRMTCLSRYNDMSPHSTMTCIGFRTVQHIMLFQNAS